MINEMTPETELLQKSLRGDRQAFGLIVERYQSLVCAITYSVTGSLAKSEELAQETFVRAWKALAQLKDLDKFRPWLCTIARNLISKAITTQKHDIISQASGLDTAAQIGSIESEPSQAAIIKEQQTIVWNAIKEIPLQYREPMVLFYRGQQSVAQVANALDLSEDAVKKRLSRGRKMLKTELAKLVEDVIGNSGPRKAFTIAVIAALPAMTAQTASAAVAATVAKASPVAKSAGAFGIAAGAIGPLLGILGSIIGIHASITNTRSPQERAFMKKTACIAIAYCFGGVGLILLLWWQVRWIGSNPWAVIALFTAFFFGVFILAFRTEIKRKAIQVQNGKYVTTDQRIHQMTKGQIYGSFMGAIFGSMFWLQIMAANARDWTAFSVILIACLAIFVIAAKSCIRTPHNYYRIALAVFTALGAINLLVVNLRWQEWLAALGSDSKYQTVKLGRVNLVLVAVLVSLFLLFLVSDIRYQVRRRRQQPPED